jgi:threonine dehydratase
VVCSSAGNHAQGFAMACRSMGIRGRVYVPAKTPKQKRDRIRYHGREFIELIAVGKTYEGCRRRWTTSRAQEPPWCRRTTIHAPSPGHHRHELLDQLDGDDLVSPSAGRTHRRYHHISRRTATRTSM